MKRAEIQFATPSCAYVRGYGTRERLTEMRGRPPVWSTLERAWVCQPSTARDLIAILEMRGYEVVVSDSARVDPGAGRW